MPAVPSVIPCVHTRQCPLKPPTTPLHALNAAGVYCHIAERLTNLFVKSKSNSRFTLLGDLKKSHMQRQWARVARRSWCACGSHCPPVPRYDPARYEEPPRGAGQRELLWAGEFIWLNPFSPCNWQNYKKK